MYESVMPRLTGSKFIIQRLLIAAALALNSHSVSAAQASPGLTIPVAELRAVSATRKFSGNYQLAAVIHQPAPAWMRAKRLEYAFGSIGNSERNRAFVSVGPVWRWGQSRRGMFTEVGFSPTILGGSHFEQADMGSVFHFTSSLSIGRRFDGLFDGEVVLRLQHISNGSLRTKNPGMDLIGLSMRLRF